jgi:hypothetical protein
LSQPETPGGSAESGLSSKYVGNEESPQAAISVVAKVVDGDGLANGECACLAGGEERPYMEIKPRAVGAKKLHTALIF